jgi:hypothetical protein
MPSASAALVAWLILASAASRPDAGAESRVSIQMPPDYASGDFPVGRKIFRLQSDLPPGEVTGITWTLDGVAQADRGLELTVSFDRPESHVIEACVTTRVVNHCDRRRLGPPAERVRSRNRLISAVVFRREDPDRPVMGLGPGDFGLSYRGKALENRIQSVHQDPPGGGPGLCMAYLFDVSGSMMGVDPRSGRGHVLAGISDGSYQLVEEVRARLQAFAGVVTPDQEHDLLLGGAFAGGLLTIGPLKSAKTTSLPGLLEKLIVKEWSRDPRAESPLWSHTALYENVALTGMVLTHQESCSGKTKVIALESDLIQFPDKAAVDVNESTLEMIATSFDRNDSDRILDDLATENTVSIPLFAVDRKMRSFTPNEERKRQEFIREVVQRSGGEAYQLTLGSAAEIREKLGAFFQRVRTQALASYDIFWDPEGIESPDQVILTFKDPELRARARGPRMDVDPDGLPRKVLGDRAGRYNNAQKLAASMFVRKRIEEGAVSPLPSSSITSALGAERRMPFPSNLLVRELQRTLLAMLLEQLKYSGDQDTVRKAIDDLATLDAVPAHDLNRVADFIPTSHRESICRSRPRSGSALETLASRLCAK